MKPYYSDDFVDLYNGDCRDIIPALAGTYQTVITDPVWPGGSADLVGQDDPFALLYQAAMLLDCARLAVHLSCLTDPRFLMAVPDKWPFFRSVLLEYVLPSYVGRILQGGDVAYLFGVPPASRPGYRVIPGRMMATTGLGRRTKHPASRVLAHVEWLVAKWTNPDDVILDPFAGSGTTLLGATRFGRRAIGIEIEERWCDEAAERLSARQQPLVSLEIQPETGLRASKPQLFSHLTSFPFG